TVYSVTSVTNTSITLSGFGGILSLNNNDRIIPLTTLPTIYSDDQENVSIDNPITTSVNGEAACFAQPAAYDVLVSGAGINSRLMEGVVVSSEAPAQVRYADAFAFGSS